jgi:DnaA family protein
MTEQLALPFAFNPELSFGQYHASANTEAVRHLRSTAAGEGESFVFIWGEPGTGKTHLLNACCREACRFQRSVSYLPLGLLRDYGPVMLEGQEYQDLVCLDDLDQVAGDDTWEIALFVLFDRLREQNHHLIAAAAVPPAALPIRLPALKTRFGWGLTLKLHPLSEADTLAALESYARSLGLDLPPQVGRFLLTHYRRDLPSLHALLDQLDHASLAAKRRLSIPFIKAFLGETT